jgi:putative hemolysin
LEDPGPGLMIVGTALCMLVLAFASAADASFTAISRHRLNALLADGSPRAQVVVQLLSAPHQLRATLILLNAGATIAATAFVLRFTFFAAAWLQAISLALLLFVLLVVSAAIPKAIAVRQPEVTAAFLSRPLQLISHLSWPLIALVDWITRPFFHAIGSASPPSALVTEEEIRLLVNVGEEEGLIEHDEREMIEGIFSFGDTLVREIMVPRVDIFGIEINTPLMRAVEMVIGESHSRVPVYRETIDNIVGILYAKDLLARLKCDDNEAGLRDVIRPAHFVPETTMVDALLKDMQKRRVHMAIVVDEYGGTAGLATIEDLLEEIVGEIQDEYDDEEELWVELISETELIADARVPIDEINDLTGLQLESSDADRIGGLLYELLGRVPKVGDLVEIDETTSIEVMSIQGIRPSQLRIRYQPQREPAMNGAFPMGGEFSGPT